MNLVIHQKKNQRIYLKWIVRLITDEVENVSFSVILNFSEFRFYGIIIPQIKYSVYFSMLLKVNGCSQENCKLFKNKILFHLRQCEHP